MVETGEQIGMHLQEFFDMPRSHGRCVERLRESAVSSPAMIPPFANLVIVNRKKLLAASACGD